VVTVDVTASIVSFTASAVLSTRSVRSAIPPTGPTARGKVAFLLGARPLDPTERRDRVSCLDRRDVRGAAVHGAVGEAQSAGRPLISPGGATSRFPRENTAKGARPGLPLRLAPAPTRLSAHDATVRTACD
jgi:hypothetical protein